MSILKKIFGGCSCGTEVKEEPKVQETACSCGGACHEIVEGNKIEIRVLGPGCKNCHTLENNTLEAVKELNIEATISHITDFAEIAKYGIMSTPGLWIDGKVVSYGKVLSKDDIKRILEKIVK
ncbi:thioredoxin family protein [uncultured Fusobacterium sp.]|jgi:small redox-active disulfide protein 2|uniref:thioredoxin family protein n=1 Tax=uncultured Fusobacterium sp. TaxID=159267 RepID=UPI0026002B45|nr:thioredoxin family protein [uncultured Fusobacterium sp.]